MHITVVSSYINSSMSVINLGIILDNTLGIKNQVNSICKSCYYQIRNIRLIRKFINDEICKNLVQALVISRLNYGNALSYNIHLSLSLSLSLKNHLQRVQNCAARLMIRTYNTSFADIFYKVLKIHLFNLAYL